MLKVDLEYAFYWHCLLVLNICFHAHQTIIMKTFIFMGLLNFLKIIICAYSTSYNASYLPLLSEFYEMEIVLTPLTNKRFREHQVVSDLISFLKIHVKIREIKNLKNLIPVKIAIIKQRNDRKCWQGYSSRGTFIHILWECELIEPLWKSVWRILNKIGK